MANSNQKIETPQGFYEAVQDLFNIEFSVDLAADEYNTKCDAWVDERHNSLTIPWRWNGQYWLNPPFRRAGEYASKCAYESRLGARLVSVWPLSGDCNQQISWELASTYVVHGRVWPEVRSIMLCRWDIYSPQVRGGLRWDKKNKTLERVW